MRDDSSINIKKYDYRKEEQYYVVWAEESNFIELDENAFKILNQLNHGISPYKIKQDYEREHNRSMETREKTKIPANAC